MCKGPRGGKALCVPLCCGWSRSQRGRQGQTSMTQSPWEELGSCSVSPRRHGRGFRRGLTLPNLYCFPDVIVHMVKKDQIIPRTFK